METWWAWSEARNCDKNGWSTLKEIWKEKSIDRIEWGTNAKQTMIHQWVGKLSLKKKKKKNILPNHQCLEASSSLFRQFRCL